MLGKLPLWWRIRWACAFLVKYCLRQKFIVHFSRISKMNTIILLSGIKGRLLKEKTPKGEEGMSRHLAKFISRLNIVPRVY
jgi:hypothetical protein